MSADPVPSGSVFARNDKGLPAWFQPEQFLSEDFDPEAYVASLRRFVPLETLAAELESYLGVLKTKLVEVINEDYNDFVSLSGKLTNVGGAVVRMQKPLLDLKARVQTVRSGLAEELAGLGEGLARRQALAAARALLELLQDTAHVVFKVEKLVGEVDALPARGGAGSEADLDATARLLERVASEMSRLHFYAARAKDLPFMQQLQPRVEAAQARVRQVLAGCLEGALAAQHGAATQHCLHAYAALGDAAGAEQVVRRVLVAPALAGVMARHQPAAARAPASPDLLAQVLEEAEGAVRGACGEVVALAGAGAGGLAALDLPANSIVAELDAQLAAALPGAFSPGLPAVFRANYQAAAALLDRLARLARSPAAAASFRAAPACQAFLGRWKLSVYFAMRFQEIAGAADTALSSPELQPVADRDAQGNNLGLALAGSLAYWHALQRALAEDVWLRPLADKFVRLLLQLLNRYAAHLSRILAMRSSAAASSAASGAAPVSSGAPQPESPAEQPQQGEAAWATSADAEALTLVAGDAALLVDGVRSQLAPALLRRLDSLPSEAVEAVSAALDDSAAGVVAAAGPLAGAVVAGLAERCLAVLRQLRGITATYRMTTRPLPTRPSHYVAGVLGPLRAWAAAPQAAGLQPALKQEVVQGVVEAVTGGYRGLAGDLLDTLRRTESSLKRLKKSRAGEAGADGGSQLSDIDKISLQLSLDVREYGSQVAQFGLQAESMPAFQKLLQVVAPTQPTT